MNKLFFQLQCFILFFRFIFISLGHSIDKVTEPLNAVFVAACQPFSQLLTLTASSNITIQLIIFCNHITPLNIQLTASTSNYEQRDFVIRELIDTESNYFDVLQALKYKFMQPMEKLLSRDELKTIYPKIKVRRRLLLLLSNNSHKNEF